MLYVAAVAMVLGLAAGLIRGGRLGRLAQLRFRHTWLVLVAFGIQAAMFTSPLERVLGDRVAPVLMASNLVLLLMVVLNLNVPGFKLFGLGLAANTLVMLVNGGYMPVSAEALRAADMSWRVDELQQSGHSDKSALMDASTRAPVLGDVIPLGAVSKVLSIGDFLVAGGVIWLIAGGMGRREEQVADIPTATITRDERMA
jgi:hypothetical protein